MRSRLLLLTALLPFALLAPVRADDCDPNDPTLLKPDLVELPMQHVRIVRQFGHRMLIFSTIIGNVGKGPLILHGHTIQGPTGQVTQATQEILKSDGTSCTHVAGDFVFHPTHHHFHFQDFERYELRKDDPFTGELVATSSKVSFCLLDVTPVHGFHLIPTVFPDCLNAEGTEGISVGWADVYDSLLPGQSIDLDADPSNPVPAGDYFLVNIANPDKNVIEINDDTEANAAVVGVSVPKPLSSAQSRPAHPAHPAPPSHPHPQHPSNSTAGPPAGPHPNGIPQSHPQHAHAAHP